MPNAGLMSIQGARSSRFIFMSVLLRSIEQCGIIATIIMYDAHFWPSTRRKPNVEDLSPPLPLLFTSVLCHHDRADTVYSLS